MFEKVFDRHETLDKTMLVVVWSCNLLQMERRDRSGQLDVRSGENRAAYNCERERVVEKVGEDGH